MDLKTQALAYINDAHCELSDPQLDDRAAALHAWQSLRAAEQTLAALLAS